MAIQKERKYSLELTSSLINSTEELKYCAQ